MAKSKKLRNFIYNILQIKISVIFLKIHPFNPNAISCIIFFNFLSDFCLTETCLNNEEMKRFSSIERKPSKVGHQQ